MFNPFRVVCGDHQRRRAAVFYNRFCKCHRFFHDVTRDQDVLSSHRRRNSQRTNVVDLPSAYSDVSVILRDLIEACAISDQVGTPGVDVRIAEYRVSCFFDDNVKCVPDGLAVLDVATKDV
ncbi:hypothetical protein D3C85_1387340 [compost metagenome]